jgi:hypothetical protein
MQYVYARIACDLENLLVRQSQKKVMLCFLPTIRLVRWCDEKKNASHVSVDAPVQLCGVVRCGAATKSHMRVDRYPEAMKAGHWNALDCVARIVLAVRWSDPEGVFLFVRV